MHPFDLDLFQLPEFSDVVGTETFEFKLCWLNHGPEIGFLFSDFHPDLGSGPDKAEAPGDTMKSTRILVVCSAIATLAACGQSNADLAKSEFARGCMRSPQANEKYCSCTSDYMVDQMDKDAVDLIGRVATTDKNITDKELAEQLGMSVGSMQGKMRRVQSAAGRQIISAARECMQYLK